jgi:hypothetical protein
MMLLLIPKRSRLSKRGHCYFCPGMTTTLLLMMMRGLALSVLTYLVVCAFPPDRRARFVDHPIELIVQV